MIKSKFAKIIDSIFIISGTFALSFYIFRFYVHSLSFLIFISICISLSVIAVCRLIFGIKSKERKEKKEIASYFEKILFLGKDKINEELNKLISSKHACKTVNGLIIAGQNAFLDCLSENFTLPKLAESYASAVNSQCKKLIVLCPSADKAAVSYAIKIESLNTIILEGAECYRFLKWLGFNNPDIKIAKSNKCRLFKGFSDLLSPDKAPRYFSLFVFFLGISFILRNSVYYIIFASILLTLSVLAKINIVERLKK